VEPIVIRDQDCLDLEAPTTAETVYLTMRELTGIYHELRSATPLDYAVLLHSSNSTRVAEDETRTSFLGMHRFLIEQHIPYRIETEQTLQQKGLGGAKVLVLPNTAHLAPETVGLIEKFVEQGGGVLATALTGGLDLQGTFTPPGQLGKLLGVEMMNLVNERHYDFSPQGEVPIPSQHPSDYFFGRFGSEDHPLIPRELKGALFDWDGYLVEVSADASSQIVAWALDYDQALINTHYFDRRIPYPGEKRLPLVVARKFGKGRTVYVAAPICQSGVRSGSDELTALLQRTILWAAGGEPPVQAAGAPMRLRITPRQADGTLLVFFNNLHTVESPYVRRERVPGTRSDKSTKRYETMQGRIVGLAPIPGFELRWDTGGRTVGAVEDQKGRALDFHQEGHWVVVNVPRLNTYLLVRLHLK
jgi:hypothetical protein